MREVHRAIALAERLRSHRADAQSRARRERTVHLRGSIREGKDDTIERHARLRRGVGERGDERLEGGTVEAVDGDIGGARAQFDGGRDARRDGGGIGPRGESETEEVRNDTPAAMACAWRVSRTDVPSAPSSTEA